MEIRADHQKGLSYSKIERKYNIDRRMAKKYAQSDSRPEYELTDSKPSKLGPYTEQITIWLEESPYRQRGVSNESSRRYCILRSTIFSVFSRASLHRLIS